MAINIFWPINTKRDPPFLCLTFLNCLGTEFSLTRDHRIFCVTFELSFLATLVEVHLHLKTAVILIVLGHYFVLNHICRYPNCYVACSFISRGVLGCVLHQNDPPNSLMSFLLSLCLCYLSLHFVQMFWTRYTAHNWSCLFSFNFSQALRYFLMNLPTIWCVQSRTISLWSLWLPMTDYIVKSLPLDMLNYLYNPVIFQMSFNM